VTKNDEPNPSETEGGVGVWVLAPSAAAADRISATLADRYATHDTQRIVFVSVAVLFTFDLRRLGCEFYGLCNRCTSDL